MSRPRVLIADDHAPTRGGVRLALEDGGFEICAEASDGRGAVEAALESHPDVCLLDVNMPRGGGIAAASEIAEHVPDARIVMLTASVDDDDLFSALRAGADGYLLKDTDPDRLPNALRGVLSGEAAMPRTLTARLIGEFQGRARRRRLPVLRERGVTLSEREWEVLELMNEGLSTAEMGDRLGVSPVTVRRHVSGILAKLRVKDRAAALRLVRDGADGGNRP